MFTLSSTSALIFLLPVAVICILCAHSDLSRMKLPNKYVIALALTYVIVGPFALSFEQYLWGFAHGVVMYIFGMFAFNYMGVGAGDGKFAAAMSMFIPLRDAAPVVILFAGFILGAFAVHRLARAVPAIRKATPDWASWTHKKFPVGLALTGTFIAYLLIAIYMPITA